MQRNPLLVGIECPDHKKFIRYKDSDVFAKAEKLRAAHGSGLHSVSVLKEMSTKEGTNYIPTSLLFDQSLRSLYKPSTHCIRDWMHCLVNDGIGGTETAMILQTLIGVGIDIVRLWNFANRCHLPRSRGGKPDKRWFDDRFATGHHVNAFASDQLNLIPIVRLFLDDVLPAKVAAAMPEHVACYRLLEELL